MWSREIGMHPEGDDWSAIARAIAIAMYHQSETATDLRWAVVLMRLAAGQLHFAPGMADRAKELTLYPYMGDQRMVRPFIRASEGAMGGLHESVASPWPERFWKACLDETECRPLPESMTVSPPPMGTTVSRLAEVRGRVVEHCGNTVDTTGVDPRHDTVFGACLFGLDILAELMRFGASTSISARLSLRTLLEVYITLA
jgi:hypothetical protein